MVQAPPGADGSPVSLVFTDVEGSTALWDHDPNAMQRALDLHNQLLRRALAQVGGYEVKTEGDAFMVAFSEATDAIQFMVQSQDQLQRTSWPTDKPIRVRMGGHVGECITRQDPVTTRMDYFGPTVNRAARVAAAGHGGQIVVTAPLADAAHPGVAVQQLGTYTLRGLRTPARLFSLRHNTVDEQRFPALRGATDLKKTLPALPGPLFGQQAPMEDIVQGVVRGHPVTVIDGPPGAGKSSLALACAHRILDEVDLPGGAVFIDLDNSPEVTTTVARALHLAEGELHQGLAELPRTLVVLDHVPDDAKGQLQPFWGHHTWIVVASSAANWNQTHTVTCPALSVDAAVELLQEHCTQTHHQDALERLVEAIDRLPRLLCSFAPTVDALGVDDAMTRLTRLVPLVEHGTSMLDPATMSSWQLLSDLERSVALVASVFLAPFQVRDLEILVGGTTDVLSGVQGLLSRHLLVRAPSTGTPRFRMLAPFQNHARGQLGKQLQAQVVSKYCGLMASYADRTAFPFGGRAAPNRLDLQQALPDLEQARRLTPKGDPRHFEVGAALLLGFVVNGKHNHALKLVEELLVHPPSEEWQQQLLTTQAQVLWRTQSSKDAEAAARSLMASSGPRIIRCQAATLLGSILHSLGDLEAAKQALDQAWDLHDGDDVAASIIQTNRGFIADTLGDGALAERYYRQALAHTRSAETDVVGEIAFSVNLGGNLALRGHYHEAKSLFSEAVDQARAAELSDPLAVALHNLSLLESEHGSLDDALALAIETERFAGLGGRKNVPTMAMVVQALILNRKGWTYEAAPLLAKAARWAKNLGPFDEGSVALGQARHSLDNRDYEQGRAYLDQAESAFRSVGEIGYLCEVWRLQARCDAAEGAASRGLERLAAATEKGRSLGLLPLVVRALSDEASLHKKLNRLELADRRFIEARRLAEELSMGFQLAATCINHAVLYGQTGQTQACIQLLEETIPRCREVASEKLEAHALATLGEAQVVLGRVDDAEATLAEAARLWARAGTPDAGGITGLARARLARERGQPSEALALVEHALRDLEAAKLNRSCVEALCLMAELRLEQGDRTQAEQCLDQARTRATNIDATIQTHLDAVARKLVPEAGPTWSGFALQSEE